MKVVILEDAAAVAKYGAAILIKQILKKPDSVLGLATGSTPVAMYDELVSAYNNNLVSFSEVKSFNLDEYLGVAGSHQQSYRHFMNEKLFNRINIDIENTLVPPGDAKNPFSACDIYEEQIVARGGIDIQLLGIGRNGHIGFNEPSSSLASRTRVKTLTQETIDDNALFFSHDEFQPHLAITMGIVTILDSKKVV
ncbi:MAG: glucosamine-6-phosphate deaminase, partial [Gammaproteobacteria bacterium]|nr:glucosamine-6-phosphate deaminase [Gammaproteobacteria bacterium]